MLIFLPLVSLLAVGTVAAGVASARAPGADGRAIVLAICVTNGLLLFAMTEWLSGLHALGVAGIASSWLVLLLVEGAVFRRALARLSLRRIVASSWSERLVAAAVAGLLLGTGLIAVVSAPNNWDSMTYHMSRVAHWVQNHDVAFYPTSDERQLSIQPFGEYAILHLQVLLGGDRLANLVQWLSLIGCLVGCSALAKMLGADRWGQLVAVVFCATLPMAILQASSTQNDLVVSLWLVCFVFFALRLITTGAWLDAGMAGVSLGLALLTKATAYLVAPPFVVMVGLAGLSRAKWRGAAAKLAAIGLLAVAINLPHYERNLEAFGHVLGAEYIRRTNINEVFGLRPTVSNLVRELSLHLSPPPTRLSIGEWTERSVRGLHRWLGIDVDDRRTTFLTVRYKVPEWHAALLHEDTAGNPLHLVALGVATVGLVLGAGRTRQPARWRWLYVAAVWAGLVLMSELLKWHPWIVRYHLPLFVLGAPLAGAAATQRGLRTLAGCFVFVSIVTSSLPLVENVRRPLLGPDSILATPRSRQYFSDRTGPYREAAFGAIDVLSHRPEAEVGLVIGEDSYEYPFWALVSHGTQPVRWCHVNVDNESRLLRSHEPCAPDVLVSDQLTADDVVIDGRRFRRVWTQGSGEGPWSIYARESALDLVPR